MTIFIACLGLFGLASFTAEKRTKEIGILKVLGVRINSIVLLLSKEFTKLVLLATLVAWPVAYFVINRWLQLFAYRSSIDIFSFIIPSIFALLIATATVSYQAIKAARSDPIKSLKCE